MSFEAEDDTLGVLDNEARMSTRFQNSARKDVKNVPNRSQSQAIPPKMHQKNQLSNTVVLLDNQLSSFRSDFSNEELLQKKQPMVEKF